MGAIGALLLSAKDDDKGEECSVLHFATLTLVSNISDLQPPLRVVTSKTTPGKKNEYLFYVRTSQLPSSGHCACPYRSQNLLKQNM